MLINSLLGGGPHLKRWIRLAADGARAAPAAVRARALDGSWHGSESWHGRRSEATPTPGRSDRFTRLRLDACVPEAHARRLAQPDDPKAVDEAATTDVREATREGKKLESC